MADQALPTPGPASCVCKSVSLTFSHPPLGATTCFCTACSKNGGTTHSIVLIQPASKSTLSDPKGVLKTWSTNETLTGGARVKHFCGECGVLLYTTLDAMPGAWLVRSCVLDDLNMHAFKPTMELWTKNRPEWVPAMEGALQVETQGDLTPLAEALKNFA